MKFFNAAALASILLIVLDCGLSKPHVTKQNNLLTKSPQSTSAKAGSTEARVRSIEFYALWKESYIKLEQWKDSMRRDVPHPDRVDVVCAIENNSNESLDLSLLATADWIVAPQGQYNASDLDKITDEVAWTAEEKIGRELLHNFRAGESREVKIKNFNLRKALINYSDRGSDTLWPWKFRVHIYIEDAGGLRVAQAQKVLTLIPKDDRSR